MLLLVSEMLLIIILVEVLGVFDFDGWVVEELLLDWFVLLFFEFVGGSCFILVIVLIGFYLVGDCKIDMIIISLEICRWWCF